MRILFSILFLYLWCGYYLTHMQRNYKSASKESAFTSQKELSDSPLSAEATLFNIMESKEIYSFKNYYVFENGDILSEASGKWRKLKHDINWAGYHRVTLHKNGKKYKRSVHRLVAQAFILNPENLPEINHLDFNRSNNNASNLEWSSRLLNQHCSIDAGRRNHLLCEGHHFAKLTKADVLQIRKLHVPWKFPPQKLADMYGTSRKNIEAIVKRKTWKSI